WDLHFYNDTVYISSVDKNMLGQYNMCFPLASVIFFILICIVVRKIILIIRVRKNADNTVFVLIARVIDGTVTWLFLYLSLKTKHPPECFFIGFFISALSGIILPTDRTCELWKNQICFSSTFLHTSTGQFLIYQRARFDIVYHLCLLFIYVYILSLN
ncbi:hypothetical protein ACJX0J_040117, partial [Zea mays]